MGLLSLAIWLPILSGAVLLAIGRESQVAAARWFALIAAVASFLVTLPLITGFNIGTANMQFVEKLAWIDRFNVMYHLGVDGISVWFVLLTSFITVIVVIAGWEVITDRVNQYMGAFLILSGIMIGVFAALDGLLFYVFFEATLIPMYIIIGVWGGPKRVYAAFKFFLYTLAGSLLMLIALMYLYFKSGGSFDLQTWYHLPLPMSVQTLLFFAFFAAFAVKVPMWPVHTWLPDAHVEAPTGGSVVLAAIMLKLGGYGFLRFSLPITPDASHEWAWLIITISLIAVIYIGLVALVQQDMKKRWPIRRSRTWASSRWASSCSMKSVSPVRWCRWCRTASCPARCSWASACCTTGCIRARSQAMAAWSTPCRSSLPSPCSSRWPTAACPARLVSSVSGWSSSARCR